MPRATKAPAPNGTAPAPLPVRLVPLADLRPHPRNYRSHPEDQLDHLMASLREHGWYRPIVIARDQTILAGHGIAEAARRLGLETAPVVPLDLDPEEPRALKVLTADNELGRFAEVDDRLLSELLREVKDAAPDGLSGTGYDEAMLAGLVMVTRPASEIADFDEAAHWVGMPDYEAGEDQVKLVITFPGEAERGELLATLGLPVDKKARQTWSTRYPWSERKDGAAYRFAAGEEAEA